jgi:hypothetical protein
MNETALKACVKYVELSREVRRMSVAIGSALDRCPGVDGKLHDTYDYESDETHLKRAYRWNDEWYGSFDGCKHCETAHNLIQQRKAARKSLGAAKRWITRIGQDEIRARRKATA